MLAMIDQHWREHLYEMDYLREGINLRAMGQRDPLAEWQREGFDMFEAMMGLIQDNFVRYVSHLQVATVAEAPRVPAARGMRYTSADDSSQGAAAMRATASSMAAEELTGDFEPEMAEVSVGNGAADPDVVQQPVRVEKTPGRNQPCFCGSGKKYKLCHGR
jgi:preprotein translocase subunit SecA